MQSTLPYLTATISDDPTMHVKHVRGVVVAEGTGPDVVAATEAAVKAASERAASEHRANNVFGVQVVDVHRVGTRTTVVVMGTAVETDYRPMFH